MKMQPSHRIIVNTLAQYTRTIINLLLSLYSSRLVLNILGMEDYGIYSLVAGVVSMLSFITSSLSSSTQRFLSVNQGRGNIAQLKECFSNSLLLHLGMGAIISIILVYLTPFIFNGFLNIPENRIPIARIIYHQVIGMVYISFMAAPYKALLIAKENILYISIVEVLDGVLKVLLVVGLTIVSFDKLLAYGWILLAIRVFNLFSYVIYCYIKYEECVLPRIKWFSFSYIKELSKYTGWIVYSTATIALRNQGVSVVLNKFMGPVINAAYGIGTQLSSMVAVVSTSFNNAISPQLMAYEGSGDRQRMWTLAEVNSKVSFLLLAMIGIPSIFEMSALLKIWLGSVSPFTEHFASTLILMQMVDLLSGGLALANKAMGNIGKYTLVTYSPKLLVIPLSWFALKFGFSIVVVCSIMLFFEILCMCLRIYLLRNVDGFDITSYCNNVVLKSIFPCVLSSVGCYLCCMLIDTDFRLIYTYALSCLIFIPSAYFFSLSKEEQTKFKAIFVKLLKSNRWF